MSDSEFFRSAELLSRHRSRLLVVDVQQKLIPVIHDRESIVRRIRFLLDAAEQMEVPVMVSEQYPQGLGATIEEIAKHSSVSRVFDKLRFSAADAFCEQTLLQNAVAPDAHDGRNQVVVVGIEAHVCVLQTATDLLARGFRVYIVADAVGSGSASDQMIAVQRLRDAGATICTAEGAAFEWCETAEADQFKTMSKLIRELRS